MIAPTWDIAYTTDDASDTTPSWTTVSNSDVRSVSVSRGRENELGRVEAGTATLILNNRARLFDPTVVTGLRPMNRWRLRAVYNAVTYDVFLGYAESYDQQWPGGGKDAITVVQLVDEFKVLALDHLPVMDPPTAQSYKDVVLADDPQGYWRLQEPATTGDTEFKPEVGGVSMTFDTNVGRTPTAIIGDAEVEYIAGTAYGARNTTHRLLTIDQDFVPSLPLGGPGDTTGLSAFTYEQWFKSSEATPAAERIIAEGPWDASPTTTWAIVLTTTGKIRGYVRNTTPTLATSTGATSISANTWYHIAIVYDGTNVLVYLNGVQDGTAALTGTVLARGGSTNQYLALGRGSPGGLRYYDEVAFYRYALPAARLLAHYTAGALRGYGIQEPKDRMASVIADSSSIAATNLDSTTGRRQIPAFMHGQAPLDELRKAEEAENGGVLFIAADGTITMLQENWFGFAPYNVVQATFDDDGTDLPYIECSVDYSETFLFNEVIMSREGGTTYTATDATSVARYMKRTLSYPTLPIADDGDLTSLGDNRLAEHKDPRTRITSLTVSLKTAAVITAVLPLDLFDLIRVLRTQPGGGARLDQQLQIQKIQLDATPYRPWQVRFSLGPY